ncbi:MAG: hypothetical protein CL521_04160 [Actinobacteria bacterium]|nr:hypothetical protein [Actinomycetota bacterium]
MGTYDLVLKQVKLQSENQGQNFLAEAKEAISAGDTGQAKKKLILAIEAFQLILNTKPYCRISRQGINETWSYLGQIYFVEGSLDYEKRLEEAIEKHQETFLPNVIKNFVVDSFVGKDWKRQCEGKFGGHKPMDLSWKQFYFENEQALESLKSDEDQIFWSIENGHNQYLQFVLDGRKKKTGLKGVLNEDQESCLERGIKRGNSDIIRQLVEYGVNVNEKGRDKWTPLHWAVLIGDIVSVRLLLDKGAKVNVKNDQAVMPIHIAAYKGSQDIIELLIEKGARLNTLDAKKLSPLHYAVYRNYLNVIELLLENGVKLNHQDENGIGVLHWACYHQLNNVVQLLIEKGAKVNLVDDLDRTPLHWAVQGGNLEVVTQLLGHGADINREDRFSDKPMKLAASLGESGIMSVLFEKGAR